MKQFLKNIYLHQRFFPGIISVLINPFFFIRKDLLKQIRPLAKMLSGELLDFGCGSKPYRSLFSCADKYIGVDIENEGHDHQNEDVDVYYDGNTLPFGDEIFDSILASEVLEHVPDINVTLSELHRVLRKSGKILITIPFVWIEHELPYDFRRLTVNGIEKVLLDSGFKPLSTSKSGAFFEVIVQMWMMYLHSVLYTKNQYVNILINVLFISPFCLTGYLMSFILPTKKNLYFNSVILAEKV